MKPGGIWLMTARVTPFRRNGMAASRRADTAERSLTFRESVGASRVTISSAEAPRHASRGRRGRRLERARQPGVVVERGDAGANPLLEVREVRGPRGVRPGDPLTVFVRHTARELPPPQHELAGSPLCQPVHLEHAPLADDLDAPAVLPGQEAAFDDEPAVGRREHAMIDSLHDVAAQLPDLKVAPESTEDEAGQVDEMRRHVLEHAVPAVPPR